MSKKLTQEEFEEKFDKLYHNKFNVIGRYQNAKTPVEIQCINCGYIFAQTPNHYDKGNTRCPCCDARGDTKKIIIGVNDMWTTHPHIATWLKNSKDGYEYKFFTDKCLEFICPNCGREKICPPKNLINGFSCNYCSNNYSYPNRFMANLLDLLDVDFKPEFMFPNSNYRFDFKFSINDIRYLVEMDGGLGHGNVDSPNMSKEEQLQRDNEKNLLAKNNNYHLIRINCHYPKIEERFEFISNNILSSKLNELFNISKDQLLIANKLSQDSLIVRFAQLWNDNIHSYDELKKHLHVGRHAIRGYAKISSELNLIDISYEQFLTDVRLASNNKLAMSKGSPVLCEQTGQVFYSISEANRQMHISLNSYFSSTRHSDHCGVLSDGTKLTWRKISKEEYFNLQQTERRNIK